MASGAEGYTDTKEKYRKEGIAAKESAAERASRLGIANTEAKSRTDVANIGALSDQNIATLKMQNDRDLLDAQINADKVKWSAADATERVKIKADIDENTAKLKQLDRQLSVEAGLKNREMDIDQAYKLGTGKLGTGSRLGGSGNGAGSGSPREKLLQELLGHYFSGISAQTMKPEQVIGTLDTILQHYGYDPSTPQQKTPQMQGPPAPPTGLMGGNGTFDPTNPLGGSLPQQIGSSDYGIQTPTSPMFSNPQTAALLDSIFTKPRIPVNIPNKRTKALKP